MNPLEIITEPLTRREGMRHLWLGDSRMGKTYANRALLAYINKHRMVDIVLTIDDKDRWNVQYDNGTLRRDPEDLKRNPPKVPDENPKHIIFRGMMIDGDFDNGIDPSDVARMAQGIVTASRARVLVNVDELADATDGNQRWKDDIVPQIYRKGGGIGISITATTQMPQLLPRESFGLSETIGIFRMSSREAAYLAKYRVIGREDIDAISRLGVGDFRLFRKSHPVDATVYRVE